MLLVKKFKLLCLFFFCILSLPALAAKNSFAQYDRFYISGAPKEKDLEDFKKKTGAYVIDLRSINEMGSCSEPATAGKLGLQYRKVSFEKAENISPEVIRDIDKSVNEAGGKPVLLFCKTGNRAAAWLAIHLVEKQHMNLEEAVKIAQGVGLKADGEKGVRSYFKTLEK